MNATYNKGILFFLLLLRLGVHTLKIFWF